MTGPSPEKLAEGLREVIAKQAELSEALVRYNQAIDSLCGGLDNAAAALQLLQERIDKQRDQQASRSGQLAKENSHLFRRVEAIEQLIEQRLGESP